MRTALHLLLLVSLGTHAVWGCCLHRHCAESTASSHCRSDVPIETGAHSHGPLLPCDCCRCECVALVGEMQSAPASAAESHASQQAACRQEIGVVAPCGLAGIDASLNRYGLRSLRVLNCVWRI